MFFIENVNKTYIKNIENFKVNKNKDICELKTNIIYLIKNEEDKRFLIDMKTKIKKDLDKIEDLININYIDIITILNNKEYIKYNKDFFINLFKNTLNNYIFNKSIKILKYYSDDNYISINKYININIFTDNYNNLNKSLDNINNKSLNKNMLYFIKPKNIKKCFNYNITKKKDLNNINLLKSVIIYKEHDYSYNNKIIENNIIKNFKRNSSINKEINITINCFQYDDIFDIIYDKNIINYFLIEQLYIHLISNFNNYILNFE